MAAQLGLPTHWCLTTLMVPQLNSLSQKQHLRDIFDITLNSLPQVPSWRRLRPSGPKNRGILISCQSLACQTNVWIKRDGIQHQWLHRIRTTNTTRWLRALCQSTHQWQQLAEVEMVLRLMEAITDASKQHYGTFCCSHWKPTSCGRSKVKTATLPHTSNPHQVFPVCLDTIFSVSNKMR